MIDGNQFSCVPNCKVEWTRYLCGRQVLGVLSGAVAFVVLIQTALVTPSWALPTATDTVKQVVNTSLPVLRDKGTPLPERRHKLKSLLEEHFDFADMSRIALSHHWSDLNPSQRSQFTQLFTAFIEDAYLNKIQDYSGQNVAILGQNSEGEGFARVRTHITQQRQPIKVDYLLRDMNGDWQIYDVTVDSVSIIANYRNQFNRVINNQ